MQEAAPASVAPPVPPAAGLVPQQPEKVRDPFGFDDDDGADLNLGLYGGVQQGQQGPP